MILLKLQIGAFGKWKDFDLDLSQGLNQFCRPNEFGKTTLIYFIYYMLYGYDAKRLKTYLPWSGEDLSGSLEFSLTGRRWRIERRRPGKGMEKRKILCLDNGEERILPNKEQPGAHFLGLDGETFLGSFCVTQGNLLFDRTDGLDVALKNMAATGDENVSFHQAEDYLNKLHTQYRHRTRNAGRLVEQKEALAIGKEQEQQLRIAVDQRLEEKKQWEGLQEQLSQKEQQIGDLEARCKAAEGSDALKLLRRLDALKDLPRAEKPPVGKEDLAALAAAFDRKEQAAQALRRAEEQAEEMRREWQTSESRLRGFGFHARSAQEVALMQKPNRPWPVILLLAAALLGVLGALVSPWLYLAAAGSAAAAGTIALLQKSNRRRICNQYEVFSATELAEKWARFRAFSEQTAALEQRWQEFCHAAEQARKDLEILDQSLEKLRSAHRVFSAEEVRQMQILWGVYESAATGQSIALQEQALLGGRNRADLEKLAQGAIELEQSAEQIRPLLERARAEQEELRRRKEALDPRDLQQLFDRLADRAEENLALEQEIAEGEERLEAIRLALGWLKEANEEMNTRFAPQLCKKAGGYLSALTEGKYSNLLMDDSFSIRLESPMGTYGAEQFSEGTKDAIYFAFRLAAGEMLGKEPLPMVLDDPFTNLDNFRRTAAEALLKEAAKERQILYFTCRE